MKRSNGVSAPTQSFSLPPFVFCAAAPADEVLLTQWETYLLPLQQSHLLSYWSTRHVAAGADIEQECLSHLDHADLILLLLSADFFASKECLVVMQRALELQQAGSTRVISLLLRPVEWQVTELGAFVCLPTNGVPIVQWAVQDEAWHACVLGLQPILRHYLSASSHPFLLVRDQRRAASDRERMLSRLRQTYKELLDHSLYGTGWMELRLVSKPDAVRNASHLLARLPGRDEQIIAPGISILYAYEQAQEELLILGASGAGKSTLLLDLALHLVERADIDETHPLPIILPLSSWAVQQLPLAEWLIEQVAYIYDVPKKLSKRWVEQEHILPLLDGLDEMEEAIRPTCIAAINAYHREHLAPLVICSRQNEYDRAANQQRLALQSAIVVQLLTSEQVEMFLRIAGPAFSGVRTAFSQQSALRELATTPLMLSVLLLTYQGSSPEAVVQLGANLEQRVWTDYVAQMVQRKGNQIRYPLEQTRRWLVWLAQQMRLHQQTIFYAEYLHTDWLALDQQRTVIWLATYFPALVIGACIGFLISLFVGDPLLLAQIGLLGGFVGGHLSQQIVLKKVHAQRRCLYQTLIYLRNAVLLGLLLAGGSNLFYGPPSSLKTDWIRDGSILGLGGGFSFWIFQLLLHCRLGIPTFLVGIRSSQRLSCLIGWLRTMAPLRLWQAVVPLGVGMGLTYGIIFGLIGVLRGGLSFGFGEGLSFGLIQGLSIIVMVVLIHSIFVNTLGLFRFVERISWTWRGLFQSRHIRRSVIVFGMMFLFYGLIMVLVGVLIKGLIYGLIEGPLEGLISGVVVGLGYWALFGLYQGIKQEHLVDQDRQQFNQGIHRSLRNGLLVGFIGAIVITVLGVLLLGLNYGLVDGLNAVLNVVWILLLAGMVVMWTLSGALMVLRHYIIRWLLARSHLFPWKAQSFLDDATSRILLQRIGGGYRFMHRQLLDYFADLDSTVTSASARIDVTTSIPQALKMVSLPKRKRMPRKVRLTRSNV